MLNKVNILKAQRARLLGSSYSEIASTVFNVSDRHERRIRKAGSDQDRDSHTPERSYWLKMQVADAAIRNGVVDEKLEEVNESIEFWTINEYDHNRFNEDLFEKYKWYQRWLDKPYIDQEKLKEFLQKIEDHLMRYSDLLQK